jgi:hypothetical protein
VRVLLHARGAGMWASAHLAAGKAILDRLLVGFGGFFFACFPVLMFFCGFLFFIFRFFYFFILFSF